MCLDDLFDQRQAQSHTTVPPLGGAVYLVEPIKDATQLVWRDADAGVGHIQHDGLSISITPQAYGQSATGRSELESVTKQVVQHPA